MPPFAENFNDSCASISSHTSVQKTEESKSSGVVLAPVSSRRRRAVRKCVGFAEFDSVVEIEHHKDMDKEEISDVWLSRAEMAGIRNQVHAVLSTLDGEGRVDGEKVQGVCLRGLLQHHRSYHQKSRAMLFRQYDIVYEFQTFEDTHGVPVPHQILAKSLVAVSLVSAYEARERALQDTQDAAL